jgi:pyridinium-3,5-biscarboxylic acid mononucleotide synthase
LNQSTLRRLLKQIRDGKVPVEEGVRRLRALPFEDLGFAKVDSHRYLRRGFPEVIYGEGKTDDQIAAIVDKLAASGGPVLVTRARPSAFERVSSRWPKAQYHELARAIVVPEKGRKRAGRSGVMIVCAGTSDVPVAEEAGLTAELMGSRVDRLYDVGVSGIHRLLDHVEAIQRSKVLVVVAGMEGALPSVVAGLTPAPVIAVPTSVGYGASLGGLAALAAMLNSCAPGLTVVNIDNGFGAGFAAATINRQSTRTR